MIVLEQDWDLPRGPHFDLSARFRNIIHHRADLQSACRLLLSGGKEEQQQQSSPWLSLRRADEQTAVKMNFYPATVKLGGDNTLLLIRQTKEEKKKKRKKKGLKCIHRSKRRKNELICK